MEENKCKKRKNGSYVLTFELYTAIAVKRQ